MANVLKGGGAVFPHLHPSQKAIINLSLSIDIREFIVLSVVPKNEGVLAAGEAGGRKEEV